MTPNDNTMLVISHVGCGSELIWKVTKNKDFWASPQTCWIRIFGAVCIEPVFSPATSIPMTHTQPERPIFVNLCTLDWTSKLRSYSWQQNWFGFYASNTISLLNTSVCLRQCEKMWLNTNNLTILDWRKLGV